jgi:hypothetical protein
MSNICSTYLIPFGLMTLIIFGKEYKLRTSLLCNFLNLPVISSRLDAKILLSSLVSHATERIQTGSFKNIILRRILGLETKEITGHWR